ncbi:MAG: hypothetical protein ACHQ50_05405 [Fimbriimonadales bacterium]
MKIGQKTSWSNPTPGTVIDVPAGESVELLFTCNNDQQKVVTFELEASGLGGWADEKTEHPVAPFDTSDLAFKVTPKQTSEMGDYPFKVRLLCGGDLVEPLGERDLVLRVTEGAPVVAEEPPPVVPPPAETIQVADLAPEKPKVERKPAVKKTITVEPQIEEPPPIADEPLPPAVVDEPQQEPEPAPEPEPEPVFAPEPEPVFAPEPVAAKPEPKPEPPVPEPPKEPEPTFFHEPEPEVVYVEEPQPEPKPEPVPVARPEPKVVKVVDLEQTKAEAKWEDEEEEPPPPVQADHTIANPKEGTSIYARPGEKVLVRFSIRNEQSGVRTYVIQEDRSLPTDWIALVQDQVNITPGGTGDVSVMLTPPINAEPATYPFNLAYGVLGQPLAPVYLQLVVQAAPAVKLKAKATTASVWVPFARALDYQLTVESQGNADTAYRVSVKDPLAERDEQGRPKGPDDLYETSTWRYLFDRELDTLSSPSANRAPTPEQHKLKLTRKGIWWFGWVEKHRMTVVAQPVTDAANEGKGENIVELLGKRWRLFPLPGFIMIPLLVLLFIMVGSGAKDLRVTNGQTDEHGVYYVVGQKPEESTLSVSLKWDAPFYAVLRGKKVESEQAMALAGMAHTAATDSEKIDGYGQTQKVSYEVGSKFSWVSERADVRFVPIKTIGRLAIKEGDVAIASKSIENDSLGEDKVPLNGREITITVPKGGAYHLNFQNLTGVGGVNGQSIVLWTIRAPEGVEISDFLATGLNNNQLINPAATLTAKISISSADSIPAEGATWEMLTTEQAFQHVIIHIKVGG